MALPINKYPFWKNALLVVLVLLGLLYALPNVFGEDPAVQISASGTAVLSPAVTQTVSKTLQAAHLPYKSMEQSGDTFVVRFDDTSTQLKGKDYIKAALGDNYIVALNLAPSTPKWLQAIGAQPMKLGLDLRGGVHFLLQVDVSSLASGRLKEDVRSLSQVLRDQGIRYSGINAQGQAITVALRDPNDAIRVKTLLNNSFPELKFSQQQTPSGVVVRAELTPEGLIKIQNDAVDQAMTVLRKRVNELGVAEAVVAREGANQVAVDIPGIQDTARAKEILGGTATLEFRLEDTQDDVQTALQGQLPFGTVLMKTREGQPILLSNQVLLKGSSIIGATATIGDDGRPTVSIRAGGSGVNLFHRATAENIGKPMATVYVETKVDTKIIDGKAVEVPRQVATVINVATIQSALGNNFQVTGLASSQEAQYFALMLRSGALLAPMTMVEENTVGPSLGKENIHKGFISVLVGFILVVLFVTFYYRGFGLIANIALGMNVIFIVAILSILGATLTLAGIAGIVLTVGMAIDANVLIFERIREELRNGMSPQAAIHAGYERAFVTIVDANVTTLIVAVILFALGTGSVQGFAVTLTIGILTSMVTATAGTRAIVNALFGSRPVKHLSIGIKV